MHGLKTLFDLLTVIILFLLRREYSIWLHKVAFHCLISQEETLLAPWLALSCGACTRLH